jgi:hypothetical protein
MALRAHRPARGGALPGHLRRLAAIAWTLMVLTAPGHVYAQEEPYRYTAADILAAIDDASVTYGISWRWLYSITLCETGHTLDPYSIGRQGERGPVQLHPRGELPRFFARGNTDPFNPYEAIPYLAQRINEGAARAWSCA